MKKKKVVNNTQRTVKVSAEVYRALSHLSKKEKKSMGELASEMILKAIQAYRKPNRGRGEQYDTDGKRIYL